MFLANQCRSDGAWGIFIHISDRTLKNSAQSILHNLIDYAITSGVHHANNPLYVDTNFASVLPVWDWLFGTLQPLKEEVKIDYGKVTGI